MKKAMILVVIVALIGGCVYNSASGAINAAHAKRAAVLAEI